MLKPKSPSYTVSSERSRYLTGLQSLPQKSWLPLSENMAHRSAGTTTDSVEEIVGAVAQVVRDRLGPLPQV